MSSLEQLAFGIMLALVGAGFIRVLQLSASYTEKKLVYQQNQRELEREEERRRQIEIVADGIELAEKRKKAKK